MGLVDDVLNASPGLCKNEAALKSNFQDLPELVCRTDALRDTVLKLESFIKHGSALTAVYYEGGMGLGKTLCAKRLISDIQKHLDSLDPNVRAPIHVFDPVVTSNNTSNYVFYDLLQQVEAKARRAKRSGSETASIVGAICRNMKDKGIKTIMVVLDEVHDCKEIGDILYRLTRLEDTYHIQCQLLLIANNDSWQTRLDSKTQSSFSDDIVTVFHPYSVNELEEILLQRIELAEFLPGSIEDGLVARVAAMAHRDHAGDARWMLDLFRGAYFEAKSTPGSERVTMKHIDQARELQGPGKRRADIRALNPLDLATLLSIHYLQVRGEGPARSPDIINTINTTIFQRTTLLDAPKSDSGIHNSLNRLAERNLVSYEQVNFGRKGGRSFVYQIVDPDIFTETWQETFADQNSFDLTAIRPLSPKLS